MDETLRVGKTPRNAAGIKNRRRDCCGIHHCVSISGEADKVSKTLKMNDYLSGESSQSEMVKNKSNFFMKTLVLSIAYFDYLGMITSVPKLCVAHMLWLLAADPVVMYRRNDLSPKKGMRGASTPMPLRHDRDRNAIALGGFSLKGAPQCGCEPITALYRHPQPA